MYASGSELVSGGLERQYRPLVAGYLRALTGRDEVARRLTDDALAEVAERVAPYPDAWRNTASIASQLLLVATDLGLAYLRHARALQIAGIGGAVPVPQPHPAGPSQWLRGAFDRFRPGAIPGETRQAPARSALAGQHGEHAGPTQRLGGRQRSRGMRQLDSRDQVRRRALRAVLADVPPEGARCLALHLVSGLSAPEIAAVLGLPREVAAAHVSAGVAAVALRYDSALELLDLSPSLFERSDTRAARAQTIVPADLHGPPTVRQGAGVTPTQRLQPSERATRSNAQLARPALPTLPAPYRAPSPRIVPIVVPVLTAQVEARRQSTDGDMAWRVPGRPAVATRTQIASTSGVPGVQRGASASATRPDDIFSSSLVLR